MTLVFQSEGSGFDSKPWHVLLQKEIYPHCATLDPGQVVILRDPTDDPDDVLRAKRSREKHYVFDRAFDETSTQEEVYSITTKGLIQRVTEGYNATVFAYGATGAGKTYTMLGTDNEPGIMAQALNDLFTEMESKKEEKIFSVTMSYLEIYNEMIRDLLFPSSGFLDLREDASGNVQVAGIKQISTTSTTEIMNLLMQGNKERTQEPTAANKTSSRSHAVLQVTVKERSRVRGIGQQVKIGKLFMIDLAGSERASQTKNRGKRMIEGAHINRSLLALGNCINALCLGGKYVNYRDSKLTRLLKDSLGGNCYTVMIANISPADYLFEESKNTLLYADRAKKIKLKVKPNRMNVNYHIAQYTNIITELKQEIERLKGKIADHQIDPLKAKSSHSGLELSSTQQSREEMDHLRHQLISNFQTQMDIRQKLMDVEQDTWELSLEADRYQAVLADFEQDRLRQHAPSKLRGVTSSLDMDNKDKERALEKDLETDSNGSYSPEAEPEEIMLARDSLTTSVLARKQKESERKKLEKHLENVRVAANKLEEVLPRKITSGEQRELLEMLCKVHELEIENTELKSRALMDRHVCEQKESIILRYEKHKQVCDQIISEQRRLITEHSLPVPMELEELYDKYAMGVNEDLYEDMRAHSSMHLHLNMEGMKVTKASSTYNLRKTARQLQEEREESNSPEKESVEIKQSKPATKRQHAHSESKPAASGQPRVFQPSPRTRQLRESGAAGPIPRVMVESPYTPPITKHESLVDLGSHGTTKHPTKRPYTPPNGISAHPIKSFKELNLSESESDINRKEIVQRTKNIAAVAARKRTSQKGSEKYSRLEKMNLHDRGFASLRALEEVAEPRLNQDSRLMHSRLSQISRTLYTSSPIESHVSDFDDLSSVRSYETRSHDNHTTSLKNKQPSRFARSVAEKRQKRDSLDQLSLIPKPTARRGGAVAQISPRRIVPQSTSFNVPGEGSKPNKRYQVNQAGEQDIGTLMVRKTTPPSTVRQIGADRGKGQTVVKRYKGAQPSGVMSNHDALSDRSTPIPATKPARGGAPVKPVAIPSQVRKGSLSVSGLAVPRKTVGIGRKL
ncbi:kinesin-like protein KIF19 [Lytechinus pictus]|uniref:kinesin-like protein KIF19 n=1 Tax=Lytechinus pictus TaxID=7653 RepID=UPI0030BA0FE0